MMTYIEVAELLRVSERTVRRLVAAKKLQGHLVGRQRRFRREDVDAYLASTLGGSEGS